MAIQIKQPFEMFFNKYGSPLNDGNVYIGIVGLNPETNPISIFSDPSMTIPVAQPLKTINGYISSNGNATDIYVLGDYSITVKDKNGLLMYSSLFNEQYVSVSYIDSISDLSLYDNTNTSSPIIVKDLDRGGTFIWSSTGTANGGTVFAGATGYWNRQYSGAINVKWFGAKGDGVADDTISIQSAVVYAESVRNSEVEFPEGNYNITGTIAIHGGIRFIGMGAMGAQTSAGTCFTHSANALNMLVWDGNHASPAFGVGGALINIQCVKGVGYSGGDAVKLIATSDNYRPGEFTIENVLIWKGDGGNWTRGLHVDGTAANTIGTKGVRSIKINKLRVSDCSQNNEYIYLNQAVHVVSEYLQIDQGSGSGTCGITVSNDSDNIILGGLILNGNLIINGTSAMNVVLNGRVSTLDINNTLVIGSANIESSLIANAAINFRITSNVTDSFMVTRTSTVADVTGDNTNYKVVFDSEVFDTTGSFVADTFTAKCAGRYLFNWCIGYTGLLSTHTRQDSGILQKRGGATIQSVVKVSSPYAQGSTGGINFSEYGGIELLLLEGDTVEVIANVSGGTKVVDVLGSAGTRYTWFSGNYIP